MWFFSKGLLSHPMRAAGAAPETSGEVDLLSAQALFICPRKYTFVAYKTHDWPVVSHGTTHIKSLVTTQIFAISNLTFHL